MEGKGVGKREKEIEDEKEKWGGEDKLSTYSIFLCILLQMIFGVTY